MQMIKPVCKCNVNAIEEIIILFGFIKMDFAWN